MKFLLSTISLLPLAFNLELGGVNAISDSLEDCADFADLFDNTCDTPRKVDKNYNGWQSLNQMDGEPVRCRNWPKGINDYQCDKDQSQRWWDGDDCMWERKLCVTCFPKENRNGDITMIRVQTNNMPNHCPGNDILKPQDFDYEVKFNVQNPDLNFDFENKEVTKPAPPTGEIRTYNNKASEELCVLAHSYSRDLDMVNHKVDEFKRALAVALNGVAFQNANQKDDDPVFPLGSGLVEDQPLDLCMGHNQRNSPAGMYHYHFFSPCINPDFDKIDMHEAMDVGPCVGHKDCANDQIQWALEGYQEGEWNKKKVIGLSRDGRPLYGPYNNNKELWTPEDVDVCNGAWEGNDYFYVSTQWHPYIAGCQGPTNKVHLDENPHFYPNCSKNGIEEYVEESDCEYCVAHQHCKSRCGKGNYCDVEAEECTFEAPQVCDKPCFPVEVGCRFDDDCCGEAICFNYECRMANPNKEPGPIETTPHTCQPSQAPPTPFPVSGPTSAPIPVDPEPTRGPRPTNAPDPTESPVLPTPAPIPAPIPVEPEPTRRPRPTNAPDPTESPVSPTPVPSPEPTPFPTLEPIPFPTIQPVDTCTPDRQNCSGDSECCSQKCNNRGKCRKSTTTSPPTLAPPTPSPTVTPEEPPSSCVENRGDCDNDSDCCSGYCNTRGKCNRGNSGSSISAADTSAEADWEEIYSDDFEDEAESIFLNLAKRKSNKQHYEGGNSALLNKKQKLESHGLDIAGYDTIKVGFWYQPRNYAAGEGFDLWAELHGGQWQRVAEWRQGSEFTPEESALADHWIQASSGEISTNGKDLVKLRFKNAGNRVKKVFIDELVVQGLAASSFWE